MIYTLTLNPAIDRELTVLDIQFDTVLRATKTQIDFGGKGLNVARLLKSLDEPSIAIGFVGGKAGELLQEGLQALGIRTDFVWGSEETRTNVSIVTPSGERHIKVNETGPSIAPDQVQELLTKIKSLSHPGDWWVLAGSLPPGVPPSFYAQIIHLLNQQGAMTVLDTSGEALRLGCLAKPFLVKPNLAEAQVMTGLPMETPSEIAMSAAAIRKMGAQNVVVSMGKLGALAQTAHETWLITSPKVQEKNPIGAGDSMVGGLVWALGRGLSLQEATGWGVASGAATASLSGTTVGSKPLIEQLYSQVRYERIEPHLSY